MTMAEKAILRAVTEPALSQKYRILENGDKFYLLDIFQSYLGNILFLFNWILPLRVMEIHQEDAERLVAETAAKSNVKPQNTRKIVKIFGVFLGLSIGNLIYSLTEDIIVSGVLSYVLFFMTIGLAPLVRQLLSLRTQQAVLVSLKHPIQETRRLTIRPVSIKRALAIYLLLIVVLWPLLGFLIIIYFKDLQVIILSMLFVIFFTYTFQAACAASVGEYQIQEVR